MRQQILVLLFLALLPLAAADGPSASVTTLTNGDACSSSNDGQSWSGNGSYDNGSRRYYYNGYAYSSANECASHADTLAAHAGDGAGPIADARVYQENATSDVRHDNASSSYAYGPGSSSSNYWQDRGASWARSDERGARVAALGASAGQASGCSSSGAFQSGGSDSSWSNTYGSGARYSQYSSDHAYAGRYANECGDRASGSIAGHGASAGDLWSCSSHYASSYDSDSSSYGDSWSSRYQSHSSRADDCRNGAAATAEDQALFAGRDDACSSSNFTAGEDYGRSNSSGGSSRYTDGSSQCFHGYIVDGPDGTHFSAGNTTSASEHCANGDCWGRNSDDQAVAWSWGASPVQFLAQGSFSTPVWIPVLS